MSELQKSRTNKDRFFATNPHSPLTQTQRSDFKGLHYFPENPDLRIQVVIDEFPTQATVQMTTTTGDIQTYIRHGRIAFSVDGQDAVLTVFANQHGFFLPFADNLAGRETYAAGRYLELEPLGKGKFLADFNIAYNPYCAYNETWSCPVTPAENRLKLPIRAGEKIYHS